MEAKRRTNQTHFVEAVVMRKISKIAAHSEVKNSAARHARTRVRRRCEYSRRRGQTLLLAVLLMIFAALLGATFITVVALNLSQTSRGTNRGEAQQAAFAGVRYANDQILSSAQGEKWRALIDRDPQVDRNDPLYDAAKFDAYYSAFEQAQGWTDYVKYPNPLALNSALRNSPTFLLKVRRIPLASEPNAEAQSGQHGGQLLLDSIGRSADDDAVFARQTAYKPTSENGGPGAFARYDSNYDFGAGRVIQTTTTAASTFAVAAPTIVTMAVADTAGFTPGRLVLVNTATARAATTVVSVSPATKEITLRFAATVAIPPGATLRAGSPLTGNIQSGRFDAVGAGFNPVNGDALYTQAASTVATSQDTTGGMLINGGLALINQIKLLVNRDTTNPQNNDDVQVAGIIARNNTSTAPGITEIVDKNNTNDKDTIPANGTAPAASTIQEQVKDNSAAEAGDPTAAIVRPLTPGRIDGPASPYLKLTRNADINNGSQYGYGPGVYIDNVDDVEKVGRLINGQPDLLPLSVSDVQRLLQRKSFPVRDATKENGNVAAGISTTVANANVNGYYDAPAGTNGDLHRLSWPRPSATAGAGDNYNYPLQPAPAASPAPGLTPTQVPQSLEERGLRGWISPWEYKPRGVLIELQGNTIIITRDDRSDSAYSNDANFATPNPQKAWRDINGSVTNNGKNYRMKLVFDTTTATTPTNQPPLVQRYVIDPSGAEVAVGPVVPFDGVIYAEGNVRVRGYTDGVTDPLVAAKMDLTIVSMNNIYVEGSIYRRTSMALTNAGHVALLAKNNVVLNPTRFIAAPNGMGDTGNVLLSNITADAAVGASVLSVDNTANWKIGDLVRVSKNDDTVYTVLAVSPTAGTITLSTGLTTAVVASTPDKVTSVSDKQVASAPFSAGEYSRLLSSNDLLLRDVRFDGKPPVGNYFMSLRHGAQRTPSFTLTNNQAGPASISVKQDDNPTNNLIQAGTDAADTEKKLVLSGDPSSPFDLLQPASSYSPATGTRGDDTAQTLAKLQQSLPIILLPAPPAPWSMSVPANGSFAARRIPSFVNPSVASGAAFEVPMTISAYLRPNGIWNGVDSLNLAPLAPGTYNRYLGGGFNGQGLNDEIINNNSPDPLDLRFYQKDVTNTAPAGAFWFNQDIGVQPNVDGGSNPVRHLPFIVRAENIAQLPMYGVGAMKLEDNNGGNGFLDATNKFTPGLNIEVDAQLYAQNGSWFVIPMPTLEPAIDTLSPAYLAMTPAQQDAAKAASTRFRRLNYDIVVQGTISQNFAPPLNDYDNEVDPDGVADGPQQRWIDSLAFPTQVATAGADKYGTQWTTIRYIGDKPPADNTLKMPISPDLLYVG